MCGGISSVVLVVYQIFDLDLDLDLGHTLDVDLPGDHRVCNFDRDPLICLREVIGQHELYTLCTLCTFVTNRLQYMYFAPASGRSNNSSSRKTGSEKPSATMTIEKAQSATYL